MNKLHPITVFLIVIFILFFLAGCQTSSPEKEYTYKLVNGVAILVKNPCYNKKKTTWGFVEDPRWSGTGFYPPGNYSLGPHPWLWPFQWSNTHKWENPSDPNWYHDIWAP